MGERGGAPDNVLPPLLHLLRRVVRCDGHDLILLVRAEGKSSHRRGHDTCRVGREEAVIGHDEAEDAGGNGQDLRARDEEAWPPGEEALPVCVLNVVSLGASTLQRQLSCQ